MAGQYTPRLWLQNVSADTDTRKYEAHWTRVIPTAKSATRGMPKRNMRNIYAVSDPTTGAQWVEQLAGDFQSPTIPEEINQPGRTLRH